MVEKTLCGFEGIRPLSQNRRVVIDQCITGHISHTVKESIRDAFALMFGEAVLSVDLLHEGAPDQSIFFKALAAHYDAIITYDGKTGDPNDLCEIANQCFSIIPEKLPGVIVLPSNCKKGFKLNKRPRDALDRGREKILTYLSSDPTEVLDLRAHRL